MHQKPEGPVFSSQLVQRIYYQDQGYEREKKLSYKSLPYEAVCWGWPAFFPDTRMDKLYIFSSRYRTNGDFRHLDAENAFIVTTFSLPDITQKNITLNPEDIKDQFSVGYDAEITQGGTLHNGHIIYSFGYGQEDYPNKIRIISLQERAITKKINLSESIFSLEEIEAVDVYNDQLMCNTNAGGVFSLGNISNFIP